MPANTRSIRRLPDGTLLGNRLLAALPRADYDRIVRQVHMRPVTMGGTLQAPRARITDVYFPNGGVYSVTNQMRNGALVEVATVGHEGMLGIRGVLRRPGRNRAHLSAGGQWDVAIDAGGQFRQGNRHGRTVS